MRTMTAFLVCALLTAAFAAFLVLLLRKPLDLLLVELCGNAARSRFWSTFWSVGIVVAGIFGMLREIPVDERSWSASPTLPLILGGFRAGLLYVLLAMGLLAFVLLLSIRRFEEAARSTPKT